MSGKTPRTDALLRPNGALAINILEHARELELELLHADKLRNAAIRFCAFIRENCGDTDDWPMEILFDNEITAVEFARLLNRLDKLTDATKEAKG
jgi:hypothetical protein